tara:strand:- start:164 stop:349 length:186 start_codon:yes stop_codon:yes gene_type:complete
MSQVYYCKLCNQKYIENKEVNSKRIYSRRVADGDKEEVKNKLCRVCSKLFNNKYGTFTLGG